MQTATPETERKSLDFSTCLHHRTLKAPCRKGQGVNRTAGLQSALASSTSGKVTSKWAFRCVSDLRFGRIKRMSRSRHIAAFPILADPVDVKKGDQQCETAPQPSIRPEKVDRPMGS